MKLLLVLLSCVAVVLCSPTPPSRRRPVDAALRAQPAISHEDVRDKFGQYAIRFMTAENTVVSERGRLVPIHGRGYVLEIDGLYSFIGDDGKLYFTQYKAGVDGFRVEAKHLPHQVRPSTHQVPVDHSFRKQYID